MKLPHFLNPQVLDFRFQPFGEVFMRRLQLAGSDPAKSKPLSSSSALTSRAVYIAVALPSSVGTTWLR
jgi:hypothetical protein